MDFTSANLRNFRASKNKKAGNKFYRLFMFCLITTKRKLLHPKERFQLLLLSFLLEARPLTFAADLLWE